MGSYEPNPASLTDFPNSDAQLEIEGTRDPQSPARLEPIGWFHGSLERPPRVKGPSFVTPTLPDINGNPSYDSSLTLPPPKKSKFCMGTSAFSRRNEEMATPSCSSKLLSCMCYVLIINARFFFWKFTDSKSTSTVTVEELVPDVRLDPLAGAGSGSNCGEERSIRPDDIMAAGPFQIPPPITRTRSVRPSVRHKKVGTDDEVVFLGQATAKMSITRRLSELQEVLDRRHEEMLSEIRPYVRIY